jgi:hypothetical protein
MHAARPDTPVMSLNHSPTAAYMVIAVFMLNTQRAESLSPLLPCSLFNKKSFLALVLHTLPLKVLNHAANTYIL